jgi:hypothetical protein
MILFTAIHSPHRSLPCCDSRAQRCGAAAGGEAMKLTRQGVPDLNDNVTLFSLQKAVAQEAVLPSPEAVSINDLLYCGSEVRDFITKQYPTATFEDATDCIKGDRLAVTGFICPRREWFALLVREDLCGVSLSFQMAIYCTSKDDKSDIEWAMDKERPGWRERAAFKNRKAGR